MNPGQVQAETSQAQAQGNALQNQYNTQSTQLQGQYQNTLSGAAGAQENMQDYVNQISGLNYGDIYGQRLGQAQQMYGFDPTALAAANKNLMNTQVAMNYAPQSAQQQGNYYGTTAGQTQNAYSNIAGNLNTTLGNQTSAVNSYQNELAATQQQANQQTTQQLAGQQQTLGGYQNLAQNATAIMQNAGSTMAAIEQLQQQQGFATAQQVTAYQNAYSQYVSAQAAQTSAAAAMQQANVASQIAPSTIAYQNAQAKYYSPVNASTPTVGSNGVIANMNLGSGGLQGVPLSSPQGSAIKLQ